MPTDLTPDRLALLRRMHEAGTPDWSAANHDTYEIEGPAPVLIADFGTLGRAHEDRDLAIAARNALPDLLDALAEARAELPAMPPERAMLILHARLLGATWRRVAEQFGATGQETGMALCSEAEAALGLPGGWSNDDDVDRQAWEIRQALGVAS